MRSTCNRLHVSGMDHCEHEEWENPCEIAVHAEANAIAFASRYGMATQGAELFVTHAPCHTCAKLVVNAGIVRVYYSHEFRSMHGVDLLEQAGVETHYGA